MKRVFFTVLVGVALTLAVVPFWGGVQARSEWNDMTRGLSDEFPGLQVRSEDYTQGWLRSRAKTRFWSEGVAPEDGVVLEHTLVHGPLPVGLLLAGEVPDRPALVVVDTDFTPDLSSWPAVEQALDGRPFARLRMHLNPDDSGVITLHSPELDGFDPAFSWRGAEGRVEFSSLVNGVVSGTISAPGLGCQIENARVQWAGLEGEFSGTLGPKGLPLVDASFAVASLEVREPGARGALFSVRNWSYEQSTEESPDGSLFSVQSGMKLESVESEGNRYGPFGMDLRLGNVAAQAIQTLRARQRELTEADSTPEEQSAALTAALMEVLPDLLAASPLVELTRLSLRMPDGDVDASAKLWLDPSAAQLPPVLAIMGVRGEAELRVPHRAVHALVDGYLQSTMGQALGASSSADDEARLRVEVVSARTQLIQTLVDQGWLDKDEKTYRTHVFYDGTAFTVNGRPLDPTALAALTARGASSLSP
jgi:uncharacterized protein YdgA (DUF945 family)